MICYSEGQIIYFTNHESRFYICICQEGFLNSRFFQMNMRQDHFIMLTAATVRSKGEKGVRFEKKRRKEIRTEGGLRILFFISMGSEMEQENHPTIRNTFLNGHLLCSCPMLPPKYRHCCRLTKKTPWKIIIVRNLLGHQGDWFLISYCS